MVSATYRLLYPWQRRGTYCTGVWMGQSVWVWKILTSPGFEPWTIQCPLCILCQEHGCFHFQCHSTANSYFKNTWYIDYENVYSCCTYKKNGEWFEWHPQLLYVLAKAWNRFFFSFVCVVYEVHSRKRKQTGKLHLCTSSTLLMCVNTRFLKLVCTVYRVSLAMKTSLQLVL